MFLKSLKFCLIILLPIIFIFSLSAVFGSCNEHDVKHFNHQNEVFYQSSHFCLGQKVFFKRNIGATFLANQEIIDEGRLSVQKVLFLEKIDSDKPQTDLSFLALLGPLIDSQILKQAAVVKIE